VHGEGTFESLYVPKLNMRKRNPMVSLPAIQEHPAALEPFRRISTAERPGETDLGV
jgi:hypothetical protein